MKLTVLLAMDIHVESSLLYCTLSMWVEALCIKRLQCLYPFVSIVAEVCPLAKLALSI